MKKAIYTISLFSLMMILTSFTTPQTDNANIVGGTATGGNVKVDIVGGTATGGNVKVDIVGGTATGGNVKVD